MKMKISKPPWLKQETRVEDPTKKEGKITRLARFAKFHIKSFHKQPLAEAYTTPYGLAAENLSRIHEDQHNVHPISVPGNVSLSTTDVASDGYDNIRSVQSQPDSSEPIKPYWEVLVDSVVDQQQTAGSTGSYIELPSSPLESTERSITGIQSHFCNCSTQGSSSFTLPVSLRSYASEPALRKNHISQSATLYDLHSTAKLFAKLRDQKNERLWNLILTNQEVFHANETAALQDEHQDKLKDVHNMLEESEKSLQIALRSKTCLQKRVKKEVLAKETAKQALKTIVTETSFSTAESLQKEANLRSELLELLTVASNLRARNTAVEDENLAFKRRYVSMKHDLEHANVKMWDITHALEDASTNNGVASDGSTAVQVEGLKTQVGQLVAELEEAEKAAAHGQRQHTAEVEALRLALKRMVLSNGVLEKHLVALKDSNENLLSNPRSQLRYSESELMKTMSKSVEGIRTENGVLAAGLRMMTANLESADEDKLLWESRYSELHVEWMARGKELVELEISLQAKDIEVSRLEFKNAEDNRLKDGEIRQLDHRVIMLNESLENMLQRLKWLVQNSAEDRLRWYMQHQDSNIAQLEAHIKDAVERLNEHEAHRHRQERIDELNAGLEWHQEQMMRDVVRQLHHTENERDGLKALVEELQSGMFEMPTAHGLRNAVGHDSAVPEYDEAEEHDCESSENEDKVIAVALNEEYQEVNGAEVAESYFFIDSAVMEEARQLVVEADRKNSEAYTMDTLEPGEPQTYIRMVPAKPSEYNVDEESVIADIAVEMPYVIRRVPGEVDLHSRYIRTYLKGKGKEEDNVVEGNKLVQARDYAHASNFNEH